MSITFPSFSQEPNNGYEIDPKPNNPASKSAIRKCKKIALRPSTKTRLHTKINE